MPKQIQCLSDDDEHVQDQILQEVYRPDNADEGIEMPPEQTELAV